MDPVVVAIAVVVTAIGVTIHLFTSHHPNP
jgi:hypothetical protein